MYFETKIQNITSNFMNKYQQIQNLKSEYFKRETGVRPETFNVMVQVLVDAEKEKKKFGGKPNKLCIEDRLLMSLEYLREYRTFFHISHSYGISESACFRNCIWVEDVLVKSGKFTLPGKKELVKSNVQYEFVVIDATETPVERPKKNA
jgi:hypothetical protein